MSSRSLALALLSLAVASPAVFAQDLATEVQVRVTPAEVTLPMGESVQLKAELVDVGGRPVEGEVFFLSRARRAVRVTREGEVTARQAGEHEVVARSIVGGRQGPEAVVKITVPEPVPTAIRFGLPARVFAGTALELGVQVVDARGNPREDLVPDVQVDDPSVLEIDGFGQVHALKPGRVTLTARILDLAQNQLVNVESNPVAAIELKADRDRVRTGDVVHLSVVAKDANGRGIAEDVPITLSVLARPDDTLGNGATGQVRQDGRFVAEQPGLYTVVATCGSTVARTTIQARKRFETGMRLEKVGHGPVFDTHTSDLWVWEGVDGRDYAVTGTWGADGDAHFWDVTDPSKIERISTVRIDARTVNDVKVSEDGRLCILSREGASSRKNGIIILDVADPRDPKQIASFDDELTGGVHNLYIDKGFVYALSAGRRYDVIDIRDPGAPTRVSSFQLFEPGASIHDVWVSDGIAFSSNWRYGLRLVDVGNGVAGGSPENPVEFANYAYPSGWNHAAFPWRSPSTNKFYVVAGDEAFPYGLSVKDNPTYPRGWIHFVDFTDFDKPDEVARYEVPEAGTHNLWIEDEVMYVAYYNAGLRVVDISGDLMGDLYRQGREIAWFLPTHPEGHVPNAPMTWGPQPYKGHIFISDWNSGLWALKLVEERGRRR